MSPCLRRRNHRRSLSIGFPGQAVSQDGDNFTVTLKSGAQATISGVAEITPNTVSLNAGYKKGLAAGQFIAGAFDGLDAQGKPTFLDNVKSNVLAGGVGAVLAVVAILLL